MRGCFESYGRSSHLLSQSVRNAPSCNQTTNLLLLRRDSYRLAERALSPAWNLGWLCRQTGKSYREEEETRGQVPYWRWPSEWLKARAKKGGTELWFESEAEILYVLSRLCEHSATLPVYVRAR